MCYIENNFSYNQELLHTNVKTSIIIATALSALLRVLLILQTGSPTLLSYEHLTYAQHISETGLPLLEDDMSWNGAFYDYAPLYHYLVAFVAIFTTIPLAAIIVTNIAGLFIPYLVYKLTEHVSTHQSAPAITAIASAAIPLLYAHTVIDTTPFTLAIVLVLLTLHVFLNTLRNPQHQTTLIITTTALALTSPLALIVAFGALLGLIIQQAQKQAVSKRLTEATLLLLFVSIWAALITYNNTIREHGMHTFWLYVNPAFSFVEIVAGIGILTVLAGSFGAFKYLSNKSTNQAYTIIGVCILITGLLILGVMQTHKAIILLGLLMLPLCSYVINSYAQNKYKSRIPNIYTIGAVIIAAVFVLTHLTPAAVSAAEQIPRAVTNQQIELVTQLPQSTDTYLWSQETGYLLNYYGHKSIITNNLYASKESTEILQELQQLPQANRIRYIEILTQQRIQRVITEHEAIPQDSCFDPILRTQTYEVKKRTCVIQSRTV